MFCGLVNTEAAGEIIHTFICDMIIILDVIYNNFSPRTSLERLIIKDNRLWKLFNDIKLLEMIQITYGTFHWSVCVLFDSVVLIVLGVDLYQRPFTQRRARGGRDVRDVRCSRGQKHPQPHVSVYINTQRLGSMMLTSLVSCVSGS